MREEIVRFMNGFLEAKEMPFANNQFGTFVREDLPKSIYDTGIVDSQKYLVTGSIGQGSWAMIPWICIFDRSITTSALRGVYIVYLLSKESDRLYLTLNQGCTDIRKKHTKSETISIMRENAKKIADSINTKDFEINNRVFLGDNLTERGELYQNGTIVYKEYNKNYVPDEKDLRADLSKMLEVYSSYVLSLGTGNTQDKIQDINTVDTINHIKSFIASKGFSYSNDLIENFYLSLKSKPFTILAGISGTGKTRLVKLFADAINAHYKMVPVRPDWSDSSDLFGHVDLNGNFVPGEILAFIANAQSDPDKPYILCLDEMNLARVEYYLSDFLSVIETREVKDEKIVSDPLVTSEKYGTDTAARNKYGEIRFPQNMYLVGTVNMDETTFPFSKKVLDRANTIEFDYVDLNSIQITDGANTNPLNMPNSFLETKYLFLKQCMDEDAQLVKDICDELQKINVVLQKANAHVGYRVRDEIVFYLMNNKNAGLLNKKEALDNEIMQKILPRIQGSSVSVKDMLCELFKILAGDYEGYQTKSNDAAAKMNDKLNEKDAKIDYPKSARKVAFMVRRFEEDGFTSYWL